MKRTFIILIGVIVLLVFGGGVVLMLSKSNQPAANTNASAATANANTAPERQIVTQEEKGPISLTKSVTYRDIEFSFTSAAELDVFHGAKPKAGNKFVILFLSAPKPASPGITNWMIREAKLVSASGTTSPVAEAKVPASTVVNELGYLWFEAANDDHNFRLTLSGATNAEATLDLGF